MYAQCRKIGKLHNLIIFGSNKKKHGNQNRLRSPAHDGRRTLALVIIPLFSICQLQLQMYLINHGFMISQISILLDIMDIIISKCGMTKPPRLALSNTPSLIIWKSHYTSPLHDNDCFVKMLHEHISFIGIKQFSLTHKLVLVLH
jgi:hypothetical protein